MSRERGISASVKERRCYFETLGGYGAMTAQNCEAVLKPRPLSEVASLVSPLSKIPPQKPKRTFEHNIYLESKLKTTFGSLSANTRLAGSRPPIMPKPSTIEEENNNQRPPAKIQFPKLSDVTYYAVSPVPLRRTQSYEELYAVPISDSGRTPEPVAAKHHGKLYYASVSVREGQHHNTKEIDRSTLLRKYAFKKQKKHKSHGRCEIAPSKLHDTRGVKFDLDRRSSRAQLVRRSTLIHKAKVEEFCGQQNPRLFEAAFIIGLQEELDPLTGKLRPYPVTQYAFPEKMEKESLYAKTAVLFYPDYSHQQKVGPDEYWAGDEEFMVAITDLDGSRKYAYCVRFLPSLATIEEDKLDHEIYPQVLTVISPIRNSIFYMDLVRNMYSYAKKGTDLLDGFLQSVHRNAYSAKQGWSLKVVEKLANGIVRNIEIKNYGQSLGKAGSAAIISRLTPEVTVCLVAALLGEQRILIAGNSVGETEIIHPMIRLPSAKHIACSTTRVVQMLEALIRPLSWPHTFIPIVPDNLLDLCDNPTPYLMGILRSNLNKVKELIIENKEDSDRRQMDFVFVDIDAGVVVPAPETAPTAGNLEGWRYDNAVKFCERMGWSRKMCTSMIKGFREAILIEPAAAADLRVENVMLKWYAELFGHYRFVGAHQLWNNESKDLLVSGQPNKEYRPFLNYLKETVMFEDWILSRSPKEKANGVVREEDPLPSSEDDLNRRIDKYWMTDFNSFTPKEMRRLAHRVANIFGRIKKL